MKKQIILSVAVAALGAALPGPARAARNSPVIYEAGRCIVAHDRGAANRLMARLPLDETEADLSGLRGEAAVCAARLAGAPSMQVRGALAQAMFMRDFGTIRRDADPRRGFINLNLPVQSSPAGTRAIELYRWADCVARNDSASTERLLRTEAGSAEEATAIEGLRNYMAACMPAGMQLEIRLWELRSVIAQSAYHTVYRYWTGQLEAARGT
ncbi:MAG TPA: hypothetical protein VGW40_09860 [Allosphingosinicella sp.]|nr:hypothetical protein [Allosphingosinicella sp.]